MKPLKIDRISAASAANDMSKCFGQTLDDVKEAFENAQMIKMLMCMVANGELPTP